MSERKKPVDQLLDVFVYAPLGLVMNLEEVLPQLIEKGHQQVNMARMFGQFAVADGQKEAASGSRASPIAAAVSSDRDGRDGADRGRRAPRSETPAAGRRRSRAGHRAGRAGAGRSSELGIPDYDSLSASQVVPRLDGLSSDELDAVRRYEAGPPRPQDDPVKLVQLRRDRGRRPGRPPTPTGRRSRRCTASPPPSSGPRRAASCGRATTRPRRQRRALGPTTGLRAGRHHRRRRRRLRRRARRGARPTAAARRAHRHLRRARGPGGRRRRGRCSTPPSPGPRARAASASTRVALPGMRETQELLRGRRPRRPGHRRAQVAVDRDAARSSPSGPSSSSRTACCSSGGATAGGGGVVGARRPGRGGGDAGRGRRARAGRGDRARGGVRRAASAGSSASPTTTTS